MEQLTALTLGKIRCSAFLGKYYVNFCAITLFAKHGYFFALFISPGADQDDGQACTRIDWKEEKTGFSLVIEAFGPLSFFVPLKSRQSKREGF